MTASVLKQAWWMAVIRAKPGIRNKLSYFLVFAFPVFFIPVYAAIGGRSMVPHVLRAIPIVYMLNLGLVSVPQMIMEYRSRKLLDVFIASPVTPAGYSLGVALSRLLYVAPALLVIYFLGFRADAYPGVSFLVCFLVAILVWPLGVCMGFTSTLFIRSPMQVSAYSNLSGLMINILPPVLYPLDTINSSYANYLLAVPSVAASHLIRIATGATSLDDSFHIWLSIGSLAFWLGMCVVMAIRATNWRAE